MEGSALLALKFASICLAIGLWSSPAMGQTIEGTNGYVSYTEGQLPIVISVPHGGALSPALSAQVQVWY